MAITTNNDKLAMINFITVYQPNLPLSPGTLGQNDQQQLLWGYPGSLWESVATGGYMRRLIEQDVLELLLINRR